MKNKQYELEKIGQTVLPSWLELVLIGLITVAAGLYAFISKLVDSNNDVQGGVSLLGSTTTSTVQSITDKLAQNNFISNLPLILFWAAIGFVVYSSAVRIYTTFSNAEELREEMDYVNSSRQSLIKDAVLRVILRLTAVVIWAFYVKLFFAVIAPYALTCLQITLNTSDITERLAYGVLGFAVMMVGLHFHIVLVRLISLRSRMLG
ncbi:MAG: hypothetical protein JWN38_830 [Candidatus Saccharibacteria bacterium]|nr:hypothetical protein [Candidatus Saccharibacteria bacterium]